MRTSAAEHCVIRRIRWIIRPNIELAQRPSFLQHSAVNPVRSIKRGKQSKRAHRCCKVPFLLIRAQSPASNRTRKFQTSEPCGPACDNNVIATVFHKICPLFSALTRRYASLNAVRPHTSGMRSVTAMPCAASRFALLGLLVIRRHSVKPSQ